MRVYECVCHIYSQQTCRVDQPMLLSELIHGILTNVFKNFEEMLTYRPSNVK